MLNPLVSLDKGNYFSYFLARLFVLTVCFIYVRVSKKKKIQKIPEFFSSRQLLYKYIYIYIPLIYITFQDSAKRLRVCNSAEIATIRIYTEIRRMSIVGLLICFSNFFFYRFKIIPIRMTL